MHAHIFTQSFTPRVNLELPVTAICLNIFSKQEETKERRGSTHKENSTQTVTQIQDKPGTLNLQVTDDILLALIYLFFLRCWLPFSVFPFLRLYFPHPPFSMYSLHPHAPFHRAPHILAHLFVFDSQIKPM